MKFIFSSELNEQDQHILVPYNKDHVDDLNEVIIQDFNWTMTIDAIKKGNKIDRITHSALFIYPIEVSKKATYKDLKTTFSDVVKSIHTTAVAVYTLHSDFSGIQITAIMNGIALSDYDIQLYKTVDKATEERVSRVRMINDATTEQAEQHIKFTSSLSTAQKIVMDIVNAPANKLLPEQWAYQINDRLKSPYVQVNILDQSQIITEGLHALIAVNRGSEDPARFVVIEYRSPSKTQQKVHIGLVGKGITFDTGGISLKNSTNMHYMKCDLGGGAAIFGTMYITAQQQPDADITAIIPITENSIGTKAIKPGDVIGSHSGKSIEIIDTDAEGRLILADGLSYINTHYKIDHLIDMATLTGSMVQTLGYHAGGVFTANDDLAAELCKAGDEVGERLWRMPIWDEYKKDMSSAVADIRNFSGLPIGGAISAAKFLEAFAGDHMSWAHIDMAGVAFGKNPYTSEKAGTAYGSHLLYQWIKNVIQNQN